MTGLNKSTYILLIPIMLYDAISKETQQGACHLAKTYWKAQSASLLKTHMLWPMHTRFREWWCTYKNSCLKNKKPHNPQTEIAATEFKELENTDPSKKILPFLWPWYNHLISIYIISMPEEPH